MERDNIIAKYYFKRDSNWEIEISFISRSLAFKYLDEVESPSLKTTSVVFLLILVVTLPPLFSIIFCQSEFLKPVKTTIWSLKLYFLLVWDFVWDFSVDDVNGVVNEWDNTREGVVEGDKEGDKEGERGERGARVI